MTTYKESLTKVKNKNLVVFVVLLFVSYRITLYAFTETMAGTFTNSVPASGDGLLILFLLNIIRDLQWTDYLQGNLQSYNFGWPAQANYEHFPIGNLIDISILKLFFSLFEDTSTQQIFHTFVLLRFPFIAAVTYLSVCAIVQKISLRFALSLAFTFIPFVFTRSEGHFVLGSTWTIPLFFLAVKFLVESKKPMIFAYFLLTIVGLNNFYFAIFSILMLIAWLATILIKKSVDYSKTKRQNITDKNDQILKIIIACTSISIGLCVQLVPLIISQLRAPSFYRLGSRSAVEGYLYAGDVKSLFSDLIGLVLKSINRPDLLAYFNSIVSWEATQVGLATNIILIALVTFLLYHLLINGKLEIENKDQFQNILLIFFITSLIFYMRSPFGAAATELMGVIRAWGRLSTFIAFITLLGVTIKVDNSRSRLFEVVLFVFFISTSVYQASIFHETRASATVLNEVAREENQNKMIIQNAISKATEKDRNCGVAILPTYPFPEFDVPYDSVGDYWNLAIPMDEDSVRWNVATPKNSVEYRLWQNLASEVPPFNRASIIDQVIYTKELNACAAVIDQRALSTKEQVEIDEYYEKVNFEAKKCVKKVKDQYFIITFKNCSENGTNLNFDSKKDKLVAKQAQLIIQDIKSGSTFWRNQTVGGQGYMNYAQRFNGTTKTSLELKVTKTASTFPTLLTKLYNIESDSEAAKLQVCVILNGIEEKCSNFKEKGISEMELDLKKEISKQVSLTVYLKGDNLGVDYTVIIIENKDIASKFKELLET